MSKRIGRARRDTHAPRLVRPLDSSQLARAVPHLAPELLHQLIRHRGLEACDEIIAAATPAQLTAVFDLDLWRSSAPGRVEQFDVDRFGDWVALLADAGPGVAARILADMDLGIVIAGLSRHVRVFDLGTLEPTAQSDDEEVVTLDPAHGAPSCELSGYLLIARRLDAWESIVSLLLTLAADHPDGFDRIMRGCRRQSNSAAEIDGLDELLTAPEQLLHNVALGRERRRTQQGYSTPADARAFLEMARRRRTDDADAAPSINPIAAAYFRAADEAATDATGEAPRHAPAAAQLSAMSREAGETIEAIAELLTDAALMPESPRALLESGEESRHLTQIRTLMEQVRTSDEAAWLKRQRELAFLANTLVAGCSVQSRPFTAQEASDAVVAICNLGLEQWPAGWPGASPQTALDHANAFLATHDLVTAFEVGWSVLYEQVSLYVAKQLLAMLRAWRCTDGEIQDGLQALRLALRAQCEAGTPWRAREALEVMATLDPAAWTGLVGLLDECPVIPAALTAVLERRTGPISATRFEFISTAAQLDAVRAFMARLPELLYG